MRTVEGNLDASGLRVAIVLGRWNSLVGERLLSGAVDAIGRHGGDSSLIQVVRVPGSFEIPIICRKLAQVGGLDGIIALGALIKGETDHYDHIASALVSGISDISLNSGIPIGFGVVTAATMEQALDRAGGKAGNKGWEAAVAVIETANVLKFLDMG